MIYTNVMLDLETMGNGPDAAIVAIGAVTFDITAGETGPAYYNRVDLASSVAGGGAMDPGTVTWWLKQSEEARLEIAREGGIHIAEALQSFAVWMNECTHDAEVWGNGASFDNVILRGAYARNGTPAPWSWWNDRCYRTVKAMHREVPMERLGTHHNAMADAISQARHLIAILNGDRRAVAERADAGYRIVMIGPNGERDYVEKLLEDGLPCICGDTPEDAGVFHKDCAEQAAAKIRSDWLSPHVAVETEPVLPDNAAA